MSAAIFHGFTEYSVLEIEASFPPYFTPSVVRDTKRSHLYPTKTISVTYHRQDLLKGFARKVYDNKWKAQYEDQ